MLCRVCYRVTSRRQDIVVYLKSPRRRRENKIIRKCFEKYRCVSGNRLAGGESNILIRNCFEKYRCIPKIASPEARKKLKSWKCTFVRGALPQEFGLTSLELGEVYWAKCTGCVIAYIIDSRAKSSPRRSEGEEGEGGEGRRKGQCTVLKNRTSIKGWGKKHWKIEIGTK